jgi:hypothetical protein
VQSLPRLRRGRESTTRSVEHCLSTLLISVQSGDATADAQTARFVVRREGAILSKRRTVNAELTGGKLTLKAPDQPSSGALYKSPRDKNPKNVFDFENDKLGSTVVKNFKAIKKPTDQYATEHIIEVSQAASSHRDIH